MERPLVYVSKLVRLPLLDAVDSSVGRIADVVLVPGPIGRAPRVTGFVATVQRRTIFVNASRVDRVDASGVALRSGTIDIRQFHKHEGELLAVQDLLGQRFGTEIVNDIGLKAIGSPVDGWEAATVSLRPPGTLRRRGRARVVAWWQVGGLFDVGELGRQIAEVRAMHPSDAAASLRELSLDERVRLARELEDDVLADVLEEMPEEEQVEIVNRLDRARVADVLEEMEPDDAADLLAELPGQQRVALLDAMEPDDAAPLRRLLLYDESTAGGVMTPEPVVALPDSSVAEALAHLREPKLPAALAAQIFVAEAPRTTPTGRFLGVVGVQRLLREPPSMEVGRCIDDEVQPLAPDSPISQVAQRLAAYDRIALPVCDGGHHLLGAVTVDDVLEKALPANWRQRV